MLTMKKQNVRTLSLIVCTFTYLLVGAAVFDALESEYEDSQQRKLFDEEKDISDKYNITKEDLELLRKNIIKSVPYKAGTQWKFAGAFYFALTVITTIGYGHSTPQTIGGKVFCMFYALSGIPLCIVMFQSVGERLNTFVTFLVKHIRKCFRMKNTEVSQTHLIFIAMNLSTIVLTSGAAIFSYFENWPYIDSFYYCFITLTTIGFGDFVALQRDNMLTNQPHYVTFCLIFILFGLTVISAAMNLLILRFLTMNTVDEKREEMEAAAAARGAVRLDGDVITANGSVVSGAQETPEYNDLISVCSCSCYNLRSRGKPRYSVTRAPGKISHLLPMQASSTKEDNHSCTEDSASFIQWQNLGKKRASI
ncbi:two pore potassium channel protein sup-9-like [Physella acuta]|uniref:two pore potassium channel protein sup-9-like n=1 Tax=Physella acuta TaxID=109671 RepID=UPI0027DD616E|nr:two pore potassium channel protein sup-9-like [Physella acuta]